ncbi:MAG TPA: ATP-binding protein [Rummeliibacillus sp.]|nr:ATP-binding protein [Rummeliibacillus sp.]
MNNKKISERASILLNKEEGYDVDYKRNQKGLSVDDLVAFANSSKGGAILLGVDESINEDGQQIGKVVGCTIGDKEKLSILNKASDCQPSVDIEIHVENEGETPFYRIEIPSGEHKPYSTFKGTYLIRGDGRNLPLNRSRLLNIFLQEQSETFFNRFKKVTEELEGHIVNLDKRIEATNSKVDLFEHNIIDLQEGLGVDIHEITSNVNNLTHKTASELNNIFEGIKSTEDLTEKTLNTSLITIENMENRISNIEKDVQATKFMTKAILEHLGIELPIKDKK